MEILILYFRDRAQKPPVLTCIPYLLRQPQHCQVREAVFFLRKYPKLQLRQWGGHSGLSVLDQVGSTEESGQV